MVTRSIKKVKKHLFIEKDLEIPKSTVIGYWFRYRKVVEYKWRKVKNFIVYIKRNNLEAEEVLLLNNKRLYRSKQNKVLAGVCGGLADYFNVDVVLIRLAYAALTVFTAFVPGVILYILAWIIVPEEY